MTLSLLCWVGGDRILGIPPGGLENVRVITLNSLYVHCTVHLVKLYNRHIWRALGRSKGTILIFIFLLSPEACNGAGILAISSSGIFTVIVATASTSNPGMITHPSANRGPFYLTSVILRELVFPTWYAYSSRG